MAIKRKIKPLFYNSKISFKRRNIFYKLIEVKNSLPIKIKKALRNEMIKILSTFALFILAFIADITWLGIAVSNNKNDLVNASAFQILVGALILVVNIFLIFKYKAIKDYIKSAKIQKTQSIDGQSFLNTIYLKNIKSNAHHIGITVFLAIWGLIIFGFVNLLKDVNWWIFEFANWIDASFGSIRTFNVAFLIFIFLLIFFLLFSFFFRKSIILLLESENINRLISIEYKENIVKTINKKWFWFIIFSLILPFLIYWIKKWLNRRK